MERLIEANNLITCSIIATMALCAAAGCQVKPENIERATEFTVHRFQGIDRKDSYLVLTRLVPDKESAHSDAKEAKSDDVMHAKEQSAEARASLGSMNYHQFQSILEGWLYLVGTAPTGYTDIIDATADGTSMAIHWKKHKQTVFCLEATNSGDKVHVDLRNRPGLNMGSKTHEDLDALTYVEITYDQPTDTWTVGTKKNIKTGTGPKDIDSNIKGTLKKIYDDAKLKNLYWPSTVDPS